MILKNYIIEKNLQVLEKFNGTLLYGENDGYKEDIKKNLKATNKNGEIIVFFENDIIKNENILFENFINESLFSEKKIIFIHEASDKIFTKIIECTDQKKKNIKLFIFSGNLEKKSKLRNWFEKQENLASVACYEDNERTLMNYISKELYGFKGITGELINIIISNSSSNRKVIQNELQKIKNYFVKKIINKEKLLDILNMKNDTGFNEIRDNALMGKTNKINRLLSETAILHEDAFFYLNNLNYRVSKLLEIQKNTKGTSNIEDVLNSQKPPIFWKDKPVYLEQLKRWNLEKLNLILLKIGKTEVMMKKNYSTRNDVIIKNLIVNLSKKAATSF